MSVKIDLTKPGLSAEERQYLLDRGRTADLRRYDRRHGNAPQAVADPPGGSTSSMQDDVKSVEHKDWEEYVDAMNVDELREELTGRDLDTRGNKSALQDRLKSSGPPQE